ncbi:hypothetical protein RHMOL_Rhmol05G0188800 [Rhododendron molle]|uniref:Uncharacterized protein n=1 Tax=Rhododendron molle TaxID=49168 RepID=A0ACC0NS57_RHOML|nr:hypothetical protein RHMOL_Rhmol05G0188800 [Rhododendron molle]
MVKNPPGFTSDRVLLSLTNTGRAGDGIRLELKYPFHFQQPNTGEEGQGENKSGALANPGTNPPSKQGLKVTPPVSF